jgi:hypothetical protein
MPVNFYLTELGWVCIWCDSLFCASPSSQDDSELMDADSSADAKPPLARWQDPALRSLTCPYCGISELIEPY